MSWQGGAPPYYQGFGRSDYDEEAQRQHVKIAFNEKQIRRDFICKVYTIVLCQILASFAFMAFTTFHEPTQVWLLEHWWMMFVGMILGFVILLALVCSETLRRTTPYNYLLLFLFTACQSVTLGVVTLLYPTKVILMAVGLTAIVFLTLTLFALIVPIDFTMCVGFLIVASILFIIFALVAMFFPSRTMDIVRASIGVGLVSFYIVIDTQLMMGGNHKYAISPEDYITAALSLYIDFVNMFLFILTLLDN